MRLRLLAIAAAVAALAALGTAAALGAFASGSSKAASGPAGTRSESIKVHGEWKLEVRNPDGRIVSVRRFHNDPTSANQAISTFLAQVYTPGLWWIQLNSNTGNGPACVISGTPNLCVLAEASDGSPTAAAANAFKTLVVSHTCCQSSIVMNGSMTAQRAGDVNLVDSNIWVCAPSTAPSSCTNASSFWPFTSRTLNTPISLVQGQQLLVTLTLSFS